MDYITAKEMAIRWGLTTRRVQVLCEQDKIEGVTRLGKVWAIPCDAKKPIDGRLHQSRGGLKNDK